MCVLCHLEDARDPWTVCTGCVTRLPAWWFPPTLSPAGVAACVDLRARLAAGEPPVELPPSLVVAPDRWRVASPVRSRRHRWAA